MNLKRAMIFTSLFISFYAQAYVPSARTILSRTVKNNGKGAYSIEQDVIFRSLPDLPVLRERWTVVNGDALRVSVSAPPNVRTGPLANTKFDIVYRSGRRTGPSEAGRVTSSPIPVEFFEPISYTRTFPGFAELLIHSRLAPRDISKPKPAIKSIAQYRPTPESFVNLARQTGTISWVIGEPTPDGANPANPAIWIEQDAFVVRKVRYPAGNGAQAEVTFDNISNYANGLRLARERTVTFGDSQVALRVVRAKGMGESVAMSQIQSSPPRDSETRLPDVPAIREFYARFR